MSPKRRLLNPSQKYILYIFSRVINITSLSPQPERHQIKTFSPTLITSNYTPRFSGVHKLGTNRARTQLLFDSKKASGAHSIYITSKSTWEQTSPPRFPHRRECISLANNATLLAPARRNIHVYIYICTVRDFADVSLPGSGFARAQAAHSKSKNSPKKDGKRRRRSGAKECRHCVREIYIHASRRNKSKSANARVRRVLHFCSPRVIIRGGVGGGPSLAHSVICCAFYARDISRALWLTLTRAPRVSGV